ncbi:flap endonuclease-1 [Candidatus Pacearchaeota archaeon]|nr:flap endonuclease-1 [Candidatus Pacearchaeota archaeon]
MGVQLGDLVKKKEVTFEQLRNRVVAVDAFNTIFQFLTTIRQIDGTPLMDSKGRVTSHLSGLFYRFNNLLSQGIKPIFVFDGQAPKLKHAEQAAREARKQEAHKKYEDAKAREELEEMAKFARQTSRLSKEMVEESKHLLEAMGLPCVQAPSEGEAQAAFIVQRGDAYAVASQDFDSLLFGSPLLLQNLTLAKKRKIAMGFVEVKPAMISLKEVLQELELTQEQLILLGILVGTDYNPGGYKGIGPKNAAEKAAKAPIEFDPQEVLETFLKIPTTKEYKVNFSQADEGKVKKILCGEHDFSEERVESALEKLRHAREKASQAGLEKWF